MAYYKPYDKNIRAKLRVQGESVYGNKVKVLGTPVTRTESGRKLKGVQNDRRDIGNTGHRNLLCGGPLPSDYHWSQKQDEFISLSSVQETRNGPKYGSSATNPILYSGIKQHINGNEKSPIADSRRFATEGDCVQHRDIPFAPLNAPVTLTISNLDSSISSNNLRRLLTDLLKKFVMILSINIVVQADGSPTAHIKVNSHQEAQYAISQLHRQKLGSKRLVISYAQSNLPEPDQLKAMVVSILQEVPEKRMPLFKFIELLESRYQCAISVSEINKLRNVCKISDDYGARIITLSDEYRDNLLPLYISKRLEVPYCTTHCSEGLPSRGWCELNTIHAPNVLMSLKGFAERVYKLLNIHQGVMPLLSFQICYEKEFCLPLPVDINGVPLEHLITCIPHVEIKSIGPTKNIKVIRQLDNAASQLSEENVMKLFAPSLAPNITLLCREIVDLLKTTERCQMPLSKFIPAYHHHFGRQCHVADYGYTKLLDLFESIPHVVQIMGDNNRRIITLSHAAQMRRFTSDLLRVLKCQPMKQLIFIDFPMAYEKVIGRPFSATEYGLCTMEDLLDEVPESVVNISRITAAEQEDSACSVNFTSTSDKDNTFDIRSINDKSRIVICVPKREQTAEEISRTKEFEMEVVDMLRHSSYGSMLFNKFVPAYHHHFGHQCKVSNYGFSKLIELFEAIPHIVKIHELPDGERVVSLVISQQIRIIGQQVVHLLENTTSKTILLSDLASRYIMEYGCPIRPEIYECNSIIELIQRLHEYVEIAIGEGGDLLLKLAPPRNQLREIKIRIWSLLTHPPHIKPWLILKMEYQTKFGHHTSKDPYRTDIISLQKPSQEHQSIGIDNIPTLDEQDELPDVISFLTNGRESTPSQVQPQDYSLLHVKLTHHYALAAQLYQLFCLHQGAIAKTDLHRLFFQHFNIPLQISLKHGLLVLDKLPSIYPFLFDQRHEESYFLVLNEELKDYYLQVPTRLPKQVPSAQIDVPYKTVQSSERLTLFSDESYIRFKKVSPPKPDTPPTPGSHINRDAATQRYNWFSDSFWPGLSTTHGRTHDGLRQTELTNVSIKLPLLDNPKLMGDPRDLISPAKHLLTQTNFSHGSPQPVRKPSFNIRDILEHKNHSLFSSPKKWSMVTNDKHASNDYQFTDLAGIQSPHPTEVPMPNKFVADQANLMEESNDSGVNSKMEYFLPSDNDDSHTMEAKSLCEQQREIVSSWMQPF